jgi:hypothetical protein
MSGTSIGELYVTLAAQDEGFLAFTAKAEEAVDKLEKPVAALGAAAKATQAPVAAIGAALGASATPTARAAGAAVQASAALHELETAAQATTEKVVREAAGVWALEPPLEAVAATAPKAADGTAAVGTSAEKTAGSAKKAAEEAGGMAKAMDALGKLFVADQIAGFLGDAVQSFLDAERVSRRLEQAMQQLHGEMGGFTQVLSGYADATERATGVDGDFIQSIQQLLLQMKIAPNEVNRVTQAAIDLAAATGGDAKQAAVLLAKASAENVAELKRWGIEVDEAKVKTEGFTAVLSEVERVYGGTANQISDAERAIVANQAAWGDLKEAIGQTVAQLLTFTDGSKSTVSVLDGLTELLTQKTTDSVYDYSQRVEQLNKARDKEIRLTEAVREAEEELQKLNGSAFYETQKKSLDELNEALRQAELERKKLMGMDVSTVAPTLTFSDEDAVDIESDFWKRKQAAADAATEAYERFSRAAEKASQYAASQSAREFNVSVEADNQTMRMLSAKDAAELEANEFIERMNKEMAEVDAAAQKAQLGADAQNAAESWQTMFNESKAAAEQAARAAAAAEEASRQAWESIGSKALGSLGKLGNTIANAAAAAAGGPFAVLASALLDLSMGSEEFKPILEMAEGIFIELARTVGQLLPPLQPLIGSLGTLATTVMSALGPILVEVGDVLQQLAPSFMVLAATVAAFAPILEVLIKPFLEIQKVIAQALFPVLKNTALVLLNIAKTIGSAWNAVVGGIQWILHQIGKLPVIGDAADNLADSMDNLIVNTDAMGRQIKAIKEMTFDSAMEDASSAADDFGQTARDAADAAREAGESLGNVPSAWRKAQRVFESQDSQSGPSGGGAPTAPPPRSGGGSVYAPRPGVETGPATPLPVVSGGPGLVQNMADRVMNVAINVTGYDLEQGMKNAQSLYERLLSRRGATSTGLSVATANMKPFTG